MLDDVRQRRRQDARRARDQRLRARRKACRACYTVELGGEVLDLLVKLQWLTEEEATNKTAVEAALGEMLRASAELERLADAGR